MKIKMGEVTIYRGCFIMLVDGGFDVVDRTSGKWFRFSNQRSARWNATVWSRLNNDFGSTTPFTAPALTEWDQKATKATEKTK